MKIERIFLLLLAFMIVSAADPEEAPKAASEELNQSS